MEKVQYRHFGLFGRGTNGVVTVAYTVEGTKMKVGMAFCSPKEKNFVKAIGREIAVKRLRNNPMEVELNTERLVFDRIDYINKLIKRYNEKLKINWLGKEPLIFSLKTFR